MLEAKRFKYLNLEVKIVLQHEFVVFFKKEKLC